MIAGHETTASTVSWALYELARRPEFQDEVRKEIKAMRSHAAQRGDGELSVADLDSMKYLLALMKVRSSVIWHRKGSRYVCSLKHHVRRRRSDTIPFYPPYTVQRAAMI
jgi:cytochrome P450